MRVHFISLSQRSPWGGSEELWLRAAMRLRARGRRVTACVKWWPVEERSERIEYLSAEGISVARWGHPWAWQRLNYLGRRFLSETFGWNVAMSSEADWAIPEGTDIVILNSPGNRFPVGLAKLCRRRAIPYLLVCQSVSEGEWVGDDELADLRETYGGAAAVFFVSRANLESTACQLAYRGDHFNVISNPYNVDRSQRFQWPEGLTVPRIAFVGRLEPEHKGIDLLFRAIAKPVWKTREFQLNLYGTGRSAQQVREMATFLGISDRVTFHGHVDSIEKVWAENHLLVLPSRHEGLPLAIIEAMMCGRPCLVTDVSGNPEHLEDGRTGFIAAGATVNAVVEALERAWARRNDWREMGQDCYEEIRRAVPQDPVADFAARIESLAASVPTD